MTKWTASRINAANYCRMRYYLRYVDPSKPKPLRLSAYVKGSLLHELVEKFWLKNGTYEEAVSTSKKFKDKKYYDPDSFGKYAQGKWMKIIIADENSENKIDWRDKEEKWMIRENISKVCKSLYSFLDDEGPPLFSELAIDVFFNGRKYHGRIDWIKKKEEKTIIRDWKSGNPWVGEMKLKHDPQLTFYNFLVCSLARQDSAFAEKLGLEKNVTKKYMGNPLYVDADFDMQFGMIEALSIDLSSKKIRTIPELICHTTRTNENYFELIKMIDGTQEAVSSGNIYPERGKKCDGCDLKEACDKKLEDTNAGEMTGKNGQYLMDFAIPRFAKKEEIIKKNPGQKRFHFRYNK